MLPICFCSFRPPLSVCVRVSVNLSCVWFLFLFYFFNVCLVRQRRFGDDISLSLSVKLLHQCMTEEAEIKHCVNDEKQRN